MSAPDPPDPSDQTSQAPKVCVILAEDTPNQSLQALLIVSGLVRHICTVTHVLFVVPLDHIATVRRVLGDVPRLRFWFDTEDAASRAEALGYSVFNVPPNAADAYASFDLTPKDAHRLFSSTRDTEQEHCVLRSITDVYGPTFIITAGPISPLALPRGIPSVDIDSVDIQEPMDMCAAMISAVQIHAEDGWVLTLADLVGSSALKCCHVHASKLTAQECRRKYRKRVTIVSSLVHPW